VLLGRPSGTEVSGYYKFVCLKIHLVIMLMTDRGIQIVNKVNLELCHDVKHDVKLC
jgi:hypothetical protein